MDFRCGTISPGGIIIIKALKQSSLDHDYIVAFQRELGLALGILFGPLAALAQHVCFAQRFVLNFG